MKGILYGVGTGPGDPELLTLKALRIIKESDVIVIPSDNPADCAAYRTAEEAWPQIREKDLLCLSFPMIRDRKMRLIRCERNADAVAGILSEGKQAAFLTIGDPSVYSTYGYLHDILRRRGYDVRIVSGIPSFCAAAAALGEILCEDTQTLKIIPAFAVSVSESDGTPEENGTDRLSRTAEEIFSAAGTKVLMKPGGNYRLLRDELCRSRRKSLMAENCGRERERLYFHAKDFPEDTGYFSVIISKPADAPDENRPAEEAESEENSGKEVNVYE